MLGLVVAGCSMTQLRERTVDVGQSVIVSVSTHEARGPDYYRAKLARFCSLSHLTVEVQHVR